MDRRISKSMKNGKFYMLMWENTEDEKDCEIKSVKQGNPYIMVYGVRYALTSTEIKKLKSIDQKTNGINLDKLFQGL